MTCPVMLPCSVQNFQMMQWLKLEIEHISVSHLFSVYFVAVKFWRGYEWHVRIHPRHTLCRGRSQTVSPWASWAPHDVSSLWWLDACSSPVSWKEYQLFPCLSDGKWHGTVLIFYLSFFKLLTGGTYILGAIITQSNIAWYWYSTAVIWHCL